MSTDDRDTPEIPDDIAPEMWALLGRHLSGEASPADEAAVAKWLAEDPSRQWIVRALGDAWQVAGETGDQAFDPDVLWARVRGAGLDRPVLGRKAVGARPTSWAGRMPTMRVGGLAAAVCAALVVVVARLPHLRQARWHAYVTVAGQRQKVTLPDGTTFTLAPASRLRVPFDYGSGDRRVTLDGEAFFAVVHDEKHPFSVRAHNAIATDIGTRFDVRAYGSDPDVRIAVTEGRVGIVGAAFTPPVNRSPVQLRPGDMAIVGDTAVAITHGLDVAAITSWTDGDLRFRDTPLPEVAATLGRWFDLDIHVKDSALARRLITMSVGTTPVDEVLSGVAAAAHARVERRGQHVTLTVNPRDE